MRVLITGSSGQIGSNLGERLVGLGHGVTGVDLRPNPWTDAFETVTCDLSLPDLELSALLGDRRFDVVVHLAAFAKVHELTLMPRKALSNIIIGSVVLEYCRETATPIAFGSSREVYGDIHRRETSEDCADFVIAESPYSASKIACEGLIYSYNRCYKLPYLVFRFSNVYGRYDCDLERLERVVPLFIKKLADGEPVTVYGKEKVLDFTYVDDAVDGILAAITALAERSVENEILNLARGEGHSLGELVELISGELGISPSVTYKPSWPGEVTRYVADLSKARELLGYDPKVSLKEGISLSVAWQRAAGWLA